MGEKGNIAAGVDPISSAKGPQFGYAPTPSGFPEDIGKGPSESFGKGPTDDFGKGPTDDFGKPPEAGFAKGPGVGASGADWAKFPGTAPAADAGPPVLPAQSAPWNPPTYPAGGTPSGSPALPPVAGYYRHTGDPDDQQPEPPPHAPPYR
jgi:hypothetical protein